MTEEMNSLSQAVKQEQSRRLEGAVLICVIASLMLTLLLEALDQTIVGTAMPRIIGELHGLDRYTWVVSAYLLASTTLVPLVGKLSDQFGRKWFLLGGTIIFLLGSALAGAAQTIDQLIIFRALQGAGAGIGIALVFTVVGDIFPPAERPKWMTIVGGVYTVSSVFGPTFGGWLAEHGPLLGSLVTDATRWRWVFYINLPIGIIATLALIIFLPSTLSVRSDHSTGWEAVRRVDFWGALLVAAATICLLLGLTWGSNQTSAWSSPQLIGILVVAALLYVGFFIAERYAVEPIIPLDLFRKQVFAADAALSLLVQMILFGVAFYVPLFLQGVLSVSVTGAGAAMTPFSVGIALGTTLTSTIIAILKRYQIVTILGTLLITGSTFGLVLMTPATEVWQVVVYVAIAALGMGALFSVLTVAAQNSLPLTRLGVGTAAVRYLGQIGGTLGVAIVGSVVNLSLVSDLAGRLPTSAVRRLPSAVAGLASDPHLLIDPTQRALALHAAESVGQQALFGQLIAALRVSLAVAIQHGFVAVLMFCGVAVLVTLFLKDVPMAKSSATK